MTKKAKKNEVSVTSEVLTEEKLQKLAHSGTEEAIEKIKNYIENEKDFDKQQYAMMALEECRMFYFQPKNEKEEQELMLSELIWKRKQNADDLSFKIEKLKDKLTEAILDGKVHDKVLAKNKDKKEEWKFNWSRDAVTSEKDRLSEIEKDLEYLEAWIDQAEKMITVKRYKNMPSQYFETFGSEVEDDCEEFCDCGEDCCEEECCC